MTMPTAPAMRVVRKPKFADSTYVLLGSVLGAVLGTAAAMVVYAIAQWWPATWNPFL